MRYLLKFSKIKVIVPEFSHVNPIKINGLINFNDNIRDFTIMLVIADGFRRPILLFLLWYHFLIFGKLTGIDLVQIWIALVPKGTGSVPQSMGKRNWSRSKGNWEIPISDQIGSGDGWSSTCTVENGWRWSRTAFPILNNQHKA